MKTKTILWIDAAPERRSRTRELTEYYLKKEGGSVSHRILRDPELSSLDTETLAFREKCSAEGNFSDRLFDLAKEFALADEIVLTAPFWDNSFPAVLKKYIEAISVSGLTFRYSEEGVPVGLCRAEKLVYVTTAGGRIFCETFGFGYVAELAKTMFGIPESILIKAEELDLVGADENAILEKAKAAIDDLFDGKK